MTNAVPDPLRRRIVGRARHAAFRTVRRELNRRGYLVLPPGHRRPFEFPPDFDDATRALCDAVRDFTLTREERIAALRHGTRHLVAAGVPGAFAECGVWRGGSMMAVALTLLELGVTDRDLYLFDTFGSIPGPQVDDVDIHGTPASIAWASYTSRGEFVRSDEVRANLVSTGYPEDRIHLVAGDVEQTLPSAAPDQLALLRLDTDYYASTAHELRTLFPRLSDRGLLLIDDYGHFSGARRATDEFVAELGQPLLLHRVDYTCRMAEVRRG